MTEAALTDLVVELVEEVHGADSEGESRERVRDVLRRWMETLEEGRDAP